MTRRGTKLTPTQVREIRAAYASGDFYQRELAVKYGVDRSLISLVVLRDIWVDVA